MDKICQKLLVTYNSGLAVANNFKGTDGKYHYLFLNIENETSYQVGLKTCAELKLSPNEYILKFFKNYQEGLAEQVKVLSDVVPLDVPKPIEAIEAPKTIEAPKPIDVPNPKLSLEDKKESIRERRANQLKVRPLPLIDSKGLHTSVHANHLLSYLKKGFLFGGSVMGLYLYGKKRKVNFNDSNRKQQTEVLKDLIEYGWSTDFYSDQERTRPTSTPPKKRSSSQWARFEYKDMIDTEGNTVSIPRSEVIDKIKLGFKFVNSVSLYNPVSGKQYCVRKNHDKKEELILELTDKGYLIGATPASFTPPNQKEVVNEDQTDQDFIDLISKQFQLPPNEVLKKILDSVK